VPCEDAPRAEAFAAERAAAAAARPTMARMCVWRARKKSRGFSERERSDCEIGKPPPAAFVSLSWPREKAKQLKLKILLLAQLNSWMRRCSQACVLTLGASRARGATPVRGQGGWWEGDGGVASTQFECLLSRRSKLYTHLPLWQPGIEVLFSGIYWYREDNFCHTFYNMYI